MEIILTKGIPASGKSTYAKKLVEESGYKRCSKDDLRAMMDNSIWTKSNEKFVLAMRDAFILECIKKDKNCVIDDTNLDPSHFKDICDLARHSNKDINVIEVYLELPLQEAIERNKKRIEAGTTLVTEEVIRSMYNKYIKNKYVEIRSAIFEKRDIKSIDSSHLPGAIIVDLDGTSCIHNGRSPYDTAKCETDLPNKGVIETVLLFYKAGYKILFVSGRHDTYKQQTINWLQKYMVHKIESKVFSLFGRKESRYIPIEYELHMRKGGDNRSDVIIKSEIYNQHIKDKYNILFAIDDRDRICILWRDLGLLCFQCADGNF